MSWITYNIDPISETDAKFLDSYNERMFQLVETLMDYRVNQYRRQSKLFEIDMDLLGTDRYNFPVPELPYSQIRTIVLTNAELWKREIYRAIKSGDKHVDTKRISIGSVNEIHQSGVLYWSDYSVSDGQIMIKTNSNDLYRFELEAEQTILGSIPKGSIAKIIPQERKLSLHVGNNDSELVKSLAESQTNQGIKPSEAITKVIAVYENAIPSAQIDVGSDNTIEYKNLFDMLGLFWREPQENSYFITNSVERWEKIIKFLDTPKKDRSLKEYYDVFGFPASCAERVQNLSGEYDAISGEEFILYGRQNEEISDDLAKYVSYVPYRPLPTRESVRQALVYTRDMIQTVENATQVFDRINDQNVEDLIQDYLDSKARDTWSDLDVKNPLHNSNYTSNASVESPTT